MLSGFPPAATIAIRRCFVRSCASEGRIAVPAINRLSVKSRRLIRFDFIGGQSRQSAPFCTWDQSLIFTQATSRFQKVREGGELRPLYVRSSTPECRCRRNFTTASAKMGIPPRADHRRREPSVKLYPLGKGTHLRATP